MLLQANKPSRDTARRDTSWRSRPAQLTCVRRTPATQSMIEHEPENASDQEQREGTRGQQLTCVRRTSATRNMNFRMPSRRAMTALSEM